MARRLTVGYMVARGLAKAGSRDPYWEGGTNAERRDDDRDAPPGGTGASTLR